MTVASPSSCDPRPSGVWPAPSPSSGPPTPSGRCLPPSLLPPPPATLPPNFSPAFLGAAAPVGWTGPGSAAHGLRPASPSPARAGQVPRRLRSLVVGPCILDAPSEAVCDGVNAALGAWRQLGCPPTSTSMAGPLVSILRTPAASQAPAPFRPRHRVRFCIPTPSMPCTPPRLHGASHRTSSPAPAAGGSREATPEAGWTRVLSRRARQEARTARRVADSSLCRPPSYAPALRSRSSSSSSSLRPRHSKLLNSARPFRGRRCFRCQAKDHLVNACRDPVRCAACYRWGHRARACSPSLCPLATRDVPATSFTRQEHVGGLKRAQRSRSRGAHDTHEDDAGDGRRSRSNSRGVRAAAPDDIALRQEDRRDRHRSRAESTRSSSRSREDGHCRSRYGNRCDDRDRHHHSRHEDGDDKDQHRSKRRDYSRNLRHAPATTTTRRSPAPYAPSAPARNLRLAPGATTTRRSLSRRRRDEHEAGGSRAAGARRERADDSRDRERPRDMRRGRARNGQRCDDRTPRHGHRDDADDDEDQRRDYGGARRSFSRRPSARRHDNTSSRRDDRVCERSPRRSSPSRGHGGRHHQLATSPPQTTRLPAPRLPSIIIGSLPKFAPMPVHVPAPPTIDEIMMQLQKLKIEGLSSMRAAMPLLMGVASPAPRPRVPTMPPLTPFGRTCRDWVQSIRASPPGFLLSSSRLASPPCSFDMTTVSGTVTDAETRAAIEDCPSRSAWGLAGFNPADADAAQRQEFIDRDVPETWDGDVGHDAWSDIVAAANTNMDVMGAPSRSKETSGGKGNLQSIDELGAVTSIASLADLLDGDDVTGCNSPGGRVHRLFRRPDVPLLPLPPLAAPTAPPAITAAGEATLVRRSARLGAKPQLPTMDRAIRRLNQKMGIDIEGEMPLVTARKLFEDSYKSTMTDTAAKGLNILFKLNLPCMNIATEALLAMAGPGGTEFAPSVDQEIIV